MHLSEVPVVVTVASGKGGVGKTRVSVDLARALQADGHAVGFLDADISTPNAPQALAGEGFDIGDQPLSDGEHLLPIDADGVHVFSQGLHLDDDVALLRGGAWKAEAVVNYIETVAWPEGTSYVIVDSPPGNGDEIQTVLAQAAPNFGFVVTTGAYHSARDARRTHELFTDADLPHAVIANMRRVEVDIPYDRIEAGVQQLHGVGDATAASIVDVIREEAGDTTLPLHDDGADLAQRVGAELVADVPFTTDDARRRAALAGALEALPEPMVAAPPEGEVA